MPSNICVVMQKCPIDITNAELKVNARLGLVTASETDRYQNKGQSMEAIYSSYDQDCGYQTVISYNMVLKTQHKFGAACYNAILSRNIKILAIFYKLPFKKLLPAVKQHRCFIYPMSIWLDQ